MDKPRTTPKDFFLWAGAMVTLYLSVFSFIALVFSYLNYAFPDALSYYTGDPYSSSVSYEMASLIVLFPIFLVLMRLIHRDIERDASRSEIWVRRWALYLTLFVAAVTLAGDLITLIMYFLNGDVSVRFLLKVLVILLVVGGGFLHFLADLWGYWNRERAKARTLGWATGGLVALTIIAGFFIIGTPWQARIYRLDNQRVSDLQQIQSEVVSYWQAKENLPATLGDLNNALTGYNTPVDPQTGVSYEYRATGALSFELCATFGAATQPYAQNARSIPIAPMGYPASGVSDNWYHDKGHACFERTIDPALFPPISKQKTM